MEEKIGRRLGMDSVEAAAGIYDIINSKMSDLIRQQVVRTGYLPEEFVILRLRLRRPCSRGRIFSRIGYQKNLHLPHFAGLFGLWHRGGRCHPHPRDELSVYFTRRP